MNLLQIIWEIDGFESGCLPNVSVVHAGVGLFCCCFSLPLKTLPVVAIYKAETGTFPEHCAIGRASGKATNWVAEFLKAISRQTCCSQHCGLHVWEFTQLGGK